MNKYDLAVAYRIYPGISKAPIVSSGDKFTLAHLCLRSFRRSLGNLSVRIWAILDGCPNEYEQLFRRYFPSDDLEIIRVEGIGNRATFGLQLDVLRTQNDADLVYFAEDDYYYEHDRFCRMVEFIRSNADVSFVSPFDHPDYYRLDLHMNHNPVRSLGNHQWRQANSTCLTFLTSRRVLQQTERVFRTYSNTGNGDASLWLSLTKRRVFNPLKVVQYTLFDDLLRRIMVRAWIHCWKQILFGNRWTLWTPIPTIATAVESSCLAPGRDWEIVLSSELRNLK